MEADTQNAAFPESYVVEIDGKIGSVYRIYIEAIKAGMELKQMFRTAISKCTTQRLSDATKVPLPVKQNRRTRNVTHTALIQHISLAREDENGENFQADMGTERFADAMDH
ncbi:MAG: hypothetical protein WA801_11460 [Pseudolabrys sp.]